ncbi:hypothetical protein [Wenzhouxiangella marina]|uniref:Uncharacterized protein n=1 Tax=Wenzhouxiangella marina TaxID=1579979 RepID=A0A0K0XWS8_9GAMM|nr:hypothetical protein [Wenzhouxiangella marina]AKS42125.1 hypothetical protein WM2015_1758 [Wenzhouxiangella marina]MBB6086103.1 putative membrane protein [Wenzhouxiangella marina]
MNFFSALVAIVSIAAIVQIAKYWIESRRGHAEDHQRLDAIEKELRERIETLERLVTDQREKLRRQIDEL